MLSATGSFSKPGAFTMGQLITSIDEVGVNQIFRKGFNAIQDMGVPPIPGNVGLPGGLPAGIGGDITLTFKNTVKVTSIPVGVSPIDLRGSGLNPAIAVNLLGFKILSHIDAGLHLTGPLPLNRHLDVNVPGSIDFATDVVVSGGANINVVNEPNDFLARLNLQISTVQVNFSGNRAAFVNQVEQIARSIDANPFMTGTQQLPQSVIDAIKDAAGSLFDQVAVRASTAVSTALTQFLNNFHLQIGYKFPKTYAVDVPGGGMISFTVSGVVPTITANQATLTLNFS
jgi:hypothetical protein